MAVEIKSVMEKVAEAQTYYGGGQPQIFEPAAAIPETRIVLQQVWTRTEESPIKSVINTDSDHCLITFTKIPREHNNSAIDSSIRLKFENGSYILRYDRDSIDIYQDWELIKTVPAKESPNNKNEVVVLKQITTSPTIVMDESISAEWQIVLESVKSLLSSLPQEFPEKEVLQKAWGSLTVTDKTTQIRLEEQRIASKKQQEKAEQEKQRQALLQVPAQSPLRTAWNRIKSTLSVQGK